MPSQEPPMLNLEGLEFDPEVLHGVDHKQCAHLIRAFDIMADKLGGVNNATASWAIATILAKIMAAATDHPVNAGERFAKMIRTAYPVMVRAMEDAKRAEDGRRPFDA